MSIHLSDREARYIAAVLTKGQKVVTPSDVESAAKNAISAGEHYHEVYKEWSTTKSILVKTGELSEDMFIEENFFIFFTCKEMSRVLSECGVEDPDLVTEGIIESFGYEV